MKSIKHKYSEWVMEIRFQKNNGCNPINLYIDDYRILYKATNENEIPELEIRNGKLYFEGIAIVKKWN